MSATMKLMLDKAAADGIDTYPVVRQGLIERRNGALDAADFDTAVLLSHAIWWMTIMGDQLDQS
jgi:hypothetical protein